MLSNAKLSPTGRCVADIPDRVARLETYERWRPPTHVAFETVLTLEEWEHYWRLYEDVIAELHKCQEVADSIRTRIAQLILIKPDDEDARATLGDKMLGTNEEGV